ncbi:MAG: YeeE/YedE family protein [Gammaproteobacteria bacterium]|nr:YeeE/YedE family protein [Gammaproteobacteria bacterium]
MSLSTDIQVIQGLIGGVLIGLSALLLLACSGKVAGVSGIVGNAIAHPRQSAWRWSFIAGLLGGATLYSLMAGSLNADLPSFNGQTALAAALVGIGTRLGSGCTSGHGVCGIGRGSPRSIAATVIFMAVAIITVAITGR